MKTMPSPIALPRRNNQHLTRLLADLFETRMMKLRREMQFYDQVLRWLRYNSRQESYSEIEGLQEELKTLCDTKWKNCINSARTLRGKTQEKDSISEMNLYVSQSQRCFNELLVEFQAFKAKLQGRFSDLMRIRLW